MVAGAPRTVSPPPKECIKLGKELLAWAKEENKKDPHLTFAEWYSLEKGILRKHWKTLVQVAEFLPYYEAAQAYLAKRCRNGTMEKSFGHRYIRLYDTELRNDEDNLLRYKSELARKEEEKKDEIESLAEFFEACRKLPGVPKSPEPNMAPEQPLLDKE